MSPIKVACTHCGAQLNLKDQSKIGKEVACPKCRKPFVIEAPAGGDEFDFPDLGDFEENYGTPAPTPTRKASRTGQKSKRARKKSSGNSMRPMLMIGGGIAAAALLVSLAVGGLWMSGAFSSLSNAKPREDLQPDDPEAIAERLQDELEALAESLDEPTPSFRETPDAATVKNHMTPEQLSLGDPIVNSIGMVLVPVPAGTFQMGSSDSARSPQSDVEFTEPFYIGAFEVTQQQYEQVMRTAPWHGARTRRGNALEGASYPASYVTWDDAMEFCRILSEQESVEYRLPTQPEWEYACRAGTTTDYSFGDDESRYGEYAWYARNCPRIGFGELVPCPVGQKLPNPWGLYDMHGNVQEWSQTESPNRGGHSFDLCGGSFIDKPEPSFSFNTWPRDSRHPNQGLRVVRAYP